MTAAQVLVDGTIYAIIGAFAGLMAGVLGIGGGIIVVPGLVLVFQHLNIIPENVTMHVAAGTSLAIMIITSQSSLRAHLKHGEVLWSIFGKLWPGIVLGTISGAIIANIVPTFGLTIIFAFFLISVAFKMITDLHVTHPERFPANWINHLVCYGTGLISGLLGVGGGIVIVPYLTYCGVAIRKIAGISNLCTLMVAIVGTLSFMITGLKTHEMSTVAYSTGYIYWPAVLWVAIPSSIIAPLGAKLNYILPIKQLKYAFLGILIFTATKLLF